MKLSEIFSNYQDVRSEMIEGVKSLTQSQLEWKPDGYKNGIGDLLVHIAEAERWWIHYVADEDVDPESWEWKEFKPGMSLDEILSIMKENFELTMCFLESYDDSKWEEISYYLNWRKADVSLKWLVWHVVEHQARHRGQIFMMMRMQGLEVPHV